MKMFSCGIKTAMSPNVRFAILPFREMVYGLPRGRLMVMLRIMPDSNLTGLLCGVMRSQLLERKKIKEGDILLNSICPGDKVMLFNSVREVFQGIIG